MKQIENFELVAMTMDDKPMLALTFAWLDTGITLNKRRHWQPASCALRWDEGGLLFSTEELTIQFPMIQEGQPNPSHLLPLEAAQQVIAQYGGLIVCAFDEAGEVVEEMGFLNDQEQGLTVNPKNQD